MAMVEGLLIAALVISVVVMMSLVMSSHYDVIETFNSLVSVQRESSQEDVDLNIDENGNVYIKNKSPTPVKIVEMRVLNDDGTIRLTCIMDETFSGGEKLDIANFIPSNETISANNTAIAGIGNCTSSFDGN